MQAEHRTQLPPTISVSTMKRSANSTLDSYVWKDFALPSRQSSGTPCSSMAAEKGTQQGHGPRDRAAGFQMKQSFAYLQVERAARCCYIVKGVDAHRVVSRQRAPLSPGIMVGSATVIFRKPRVFVGW